ncbi:MAG: hypothetical protein PQ612_06450 [Rickettsiales bacterium]|nr:hypothetical protein [Pseudomonadota bacterium]MDA0966613.1 hypothetical protein [Pseudomonadota bacterium]MDG4543641.1 hypothetical protein [Rickettsiales bacterium]MDG4545788.1 hypothetical protein [Rickettsiales bacterium]MDG4547438.1 hypothetical protein [Rickettsiales bacterium]
MAYEFKNAIKYELDTAYVRHDIIADCYRIEISDASTVNAIVTVQLILEDRTKVDDIRLKKGAFYESPIKIDYLKLTSSAQPLEWVEFRFTDMSNPPDRPEYDSGVKEVIDSVGSVDEIKGSVKTKSGDTIVATKVTVGTTEVTLLAADTTRTRATIYSYGNIGKVCFIGESGVDTASSFPLVAGASMTIESGAEVKAIGDSTGIDIRIFEERL